MREFTLVERTEPFTLKEVIDFIDDEATDISKLDAHELKCRIVDVIQAERSKAIDNFFDNLQEYETEDNWLRLKMSSIYEIAEQLKGGSDDR